MKRERELGDLMRDYNLIISRMMVDIQSEAINLLEYSKDRDMTVDELAVIVTTALVKMNGGRIKMIKDYLDGISMDENMSAHEKWKAGDMIYEEDYLLNKLGIMMELNMRRNLTVIIKEGNYANEPEKVSKEIQHLSLYYEMELQNEFKEVRESESQRKKDFMRGLNSGGSLKRLMRRVAILGI